MLQNVFSDKSAATRTLRKMNTQDSLETTIKSCALHANVKKMAGVCTVIPSSNGHYFDITIRRQTDFFAQSTPLTIRRGPFYRAVEAHDFWLTDAEWQRVGSELSNWQQDWQNFSRVLRGTDCLKALEQAKLCALFSRRQNTVYIEFFNRVYGLCLCLEAMEVKGTDGGVLNLFDNLLKLLDDIMKRDIVCAFFKEARMQIDKVDGRWGLDVLQNWRDSKYLVSVAPRIEQGGVHFTWHLENGCLIHREIHKSTAIPSPMTNCGPCKTFFDVTAKQIDDALWRSN